MSDDLVKRASFALSDMQGRIDATKLQVFQNCIDRIEELETKLAKAVEVGNKMAHSIEGNYYLPNIAGEWRKVAVEIKGESHE